MKNFMPLPHLSSRVLLTLYMASPPTPCLNADNPGNVIVETEQDYHIYKSS